jgi:hypothetical protein
VIFKLAETKKTSCLFQVYKNPYGEFWIKGIHLPLREGGQVQSVLKKLWEKAEEI